MDSSLSLLVRSKIDDSAQQIKSLETQIEALSSKIKTAISVKLQIDAKQLDVLVKDVENIQNKIKTRTEVKGSQFINSKVENQAFNEISSRIREIRKNIDELAKVDISTNKKGQMTSASLTYYNKELAQTVKETMGWSESQKKINGELVKIKSFGTTGFKYSDDIAKANKEAEKLVENANKVNNALYKQKSSTNQRNFNYGTKLEGVDSSIFDSRDSFLGSIKSQYGETAEIIGKFNAEQSKTGEIIKRVTYHAQDGQGNWRKYTDTLNMTTGEMYRLDAGMSKVINRELTLGTALRTAMEKFPIWIGVSTAYMSVIHGISQGLQTLKELDSQMVSIAKVTNLSADAMDRLKKGSFEAASAFGRTAQDYLSSIAEFSRAGYDSQAEGLSKLSLLGQNVGELTAEQANAFLLATDAAYKYKGSQEELAKVLDGVNQIDNRFATSIQKVSEGVTVAGSVASNAGVGVNELSAAVGTMTAITQKSGNEAGRAFRSILMNIRQIKGETEDGEIIDDAALSKSAKALDDVGIKVHEMRNGIEELRNPMDVLKELADKWQSLSTMQQSPIIEALAGKYRANQLTALLENFDMYQKMLTEYTNASGSAMAENEKRMTSWETKANQLSNTMGKFWNNTIDTNLIKGFIDTLNGLVSVLDGTLNNSFTQFVLQVGLTSAALYGAGIAANALKNSYLGTTVGVFALDFAEKGLATTTKALTATMLASPLFWVVAGTTAIFGIVKLVNLFTISLEEQKQKVQSLTDSYNNLNTQLKQLQEIENPTAEQTEKIKLLERELELKNEILQKEKESLIGKDVFGQGVLGDGISGKVKDDIQNYNDLQNAIKNTEKEIEYLHSQGFEASIEIEHLEDLKSQLKEIELSFIESKKTLTDYANSASGENKEKILAIIAAIDNFLPSLQKQNAENKENAKSAKEASNANFDLTQALKSVNDAIDKSQTSLKELNSVLSDNGKLTAEQVLDLIQKYPELQDKISKTTEGYYIQTDALEVLRKKSIEKSIDSIDAQIKEAENVKLKTLDNLKHYDLEIEKLQDIANAKLIIAKLDAREKANQVTGGSSDAGIWNGVYSKAYDEAIEKGNADINAYEKAVNDLQSLLDKKGTIETLLNDKTLGVSSDKGNNDPTNKDAEKYKLEKDRYMGLTQILNDVNNALEENKVLQEQAGNSSIELLDKEISLLEQKRKAINDITWEQKQEANDLRWSLETVRGIKFDSNGNIDQSSYDSLVDSKVNDINNMKSGDARDAAIQDLEHLKKAAQDYIDLMTSKIPKNTVDMIQIGGDIAKVQADKISILKKQLDDTLNDKEHELFLGQKSNSGDYAKQIELYKQMQDELHKMAEYYRSLGYKETDDEIQELQKKWWGYEDSISHLKEDSLKNATEAMTNIWKQYYDDLKKKEEDNHNDRLKNIQSVIDALEEQYATEDYLSNLKKQDSAIVQKQNQINALANDNSTEGLAKKAKLQQELNDLIEKKNETTQQHTRDEAKKTLEKLKDNEDERYKKVTDNLDDLSSETAIATKVQEQLNKDSVDTIISKYQDLGKEVGKVYDSMIDKAKAYITQAKAVSITTGTTPNTATTSTTNTNTSSNGNQKVSLRDYLTSKGLTITTEDNPSIPSGVNVYVNGKPLDTSAFTMENDRFYATEELIKAALRKANIPGFLDGGVVDYSGLAWVHGTKTKPEGFLDNFDMTNLLKVIDITKQIIPSIKTFNPSNIVPNNNRGVNIQKVETHVYASAGMDENKLANLVENRIYNNISTKLALGGV